MNGEVDSSVSHGEDVQIATRCAADYEPKPETRFLNGVVSDGSSVVPKEQMALNSDGDQPVTAETVAAGPSDPPNNNVQPLAMNGEEQIPSDTPIDELRQLLLTQLEYYFSPENLSNDKFLVSQMDSDQYVYISTVANFNLIKKLSSDLDLITDVLKESKQVQVHSDGKRIRPISNRTVVILRGIPESTPIDEIKALFEKENSPKCNNCEFAFNDSWYLSFDNDDEAVRAHRYLREDVREFKGHPIMARIKSRPTTLLSQGVGVNPVKNGYNPPPQPTIPQYMNVPYVSQSTQGNQPGPTAVAAPIFTGQQMAPAVFTIPTGPYASFGTQVPWAGYYDLNSAAIFSINGLQQPQSQPSPNYNNKGIQMAPRNRNTKSETDNYYRMPRGPRRGENSSSAAGNYPPHQYGGGGGGNQHRKNSGPQPLLGMPPLPLNSHHTPSHSHNHSHHGGHLVGSGNSSNMNRNSSVHYNNSSLSSHNVPHNVSESYHYSNSSRYRGGGNDNRPRSSLGTRKPPRSYEDDSNYEHHNHHNSSATNAVSSTSRGNPSTRQIPSTPVSPQPPASQRVSSPQNQGGKTNFDLESNAFPPLPGAVNSTGVKNGDSAYEGRLSDVVKGVKNVKLNPTGEREDAATNTAPSELLVVSAQDNLRESTYVVSAASPTKELDSPKELSSQSNACEHKKEFREVGVGSADDSRSTIRAVPFREPSAPVVKNKETADKSTRTDTALLHGDRQPDKPSSGAKSAAAGDSHQNSSGSDNYRKSVPQSTKSPIVNKRGAPGSQQHGPLMSSVAVGSEVPYSHKDSSPVKHNANATTSGHVDSGRDRERTGSAAYVAKIQGDNNSRTGTSVSQSNHRGNFNTSDNDAFPAPGTVKSNVPTNKAASSGMTDLTGVSRSDEKAKDSDKKKGGDENICSNEDPVRLSYAQILAQSRKDKVSQNSNAQLPQASSSSSSTMSQPGSGPGTTSNAQPGSSEDRKKFMTESKDSRPLSKANFQRGNSNGSDGGSDRGGRGGPGPGGYRRFRNRLPSENSEGGGGNSNFSGRPPPRRTRSPR